MRGRPCGRSIGRHAGMRSVIGRSWLARAASDEHAAGPRSRNVRIATRVVVKAS